MEKLIKYLPDLVLSALKNDNNSFESILITMIRILNKDETHKKTADKLSKILKEHQSGKLKETKYTRAVNSVTLSSYSDNTEFFKVINSQISLNNLEFDSKVVNVVSEIISSYKNKDMLEKNNISYIRKVIITGKPGTGKTSIGYAIANELNLPLYYVNISTLFSSYLGTSAKNLQKLFSEMLTHNGIFLFDEFDSLGISRSESNEVGEMRRIVNSLLTYLENWEGEGIIIATSNDSGKLDDAIWRRFDVNFTIDLPNNFLRFKLLNKSLGKYLNNQELNLITSITEGYSPADLELLALNAIRSHLLNNKNVFIKLLDIINLEDIDNHKKKLLTKEIKNNLPNITYREIGVLLDVSKSTVGRYLKEE